MIYFNLCQQGHIPSIRTYNFTKSAKVFKRMKIVKSGNFTFTDNEKRWFLSLPRAVNQLVRLQAFYGALTTSSISLLFKLVLV